ncbi:MAG: transglutaminase-like domain-containing protein [Oscillospiraceae bacterium]|nr:transglutaminase-like domain-containing protein [Oscillospiraceae bacterium]
MRRVVAVLFLLLFLSNLSACDGILNSEYRSVAPHMEQRPLSGDQTEWQASNLTDLKNILKQIIRAAGETVRIKLSDYIGNINNDIPRAGYDITSEDPIAAYTVNYILHDLMPLGHEVTYTIFYKQDRVGEIREVPGIEDLNDEMDKAIESNLARLVLEIRYYVGLADLGAQFREAYYRMPERAVGMPSLTYALYPDQGFSRVVELDFTYPHSVSETEVRMRLVRKALNDLKGELPPDLDPPFLALALYDLVCGTIKYDAEAAQRKSKGEFGDADDNLYSALVKGRATSAGYALVYQLLCDRVGIECRLVFVGGMRANTAHLWNIIRLDGDWYHVDAAADAQAGGTHDWFLKTDADMHEIARWDTTAVEACVSTKYNYDMLMQILNPDDPDVTPSAEPETPGATPGESPGATPEATPGVTPGVTPGESPPGESPSVGPET